MNALIGELVKTIARGSRRDKKWQAVTRETAAELLKTLPVALIRNAAELNNVLPPDVDKVGFRSEPQFALTYRNFDGVLSMAEDGQKLDFVIRDRTRHDVDPISEVHVAVYGYGGFASYNMYGDTLIVKIDHLSWGLLTRFVNATNADRAPNE